MARYSNPFSSSPYPTGSAWAVAGESLAKAFLGDPAAAAAQAQHEAKLKALDAGAFADENRGNLYGLQGQQVSMENNARGGGIADAFRTMVTRLQPSSAGAGGDVGSLVPQVAPAAVDPRRVMLEAMPEIIGQLSAGGQIAEAGELAQLFAAFTGDENTGRAGRVGAGHDVDTDFALTTGRADTLRTQDFAQATSLNDADNATARYGHDRDYQASTQNNVRDNVTSRANNTDDNRTEITKHRTVSGDTVYQTKAGARVDNTSGANAIAAALGPDVVITDNARSDRENARLSDSSPTSWHLDRNGAKGFDIRKVPGLSGKEARRRIQAEATARGGRLIEWKEYGDHWHAAVDVPKGSKPTNEQTKTVKVAKDVSDAIEEGVNTRHADESSGVRNRLAAMAVKEYQKTGNIPEALNRVQDVWAKNKPGAKGENSGGWKVTRKGS